MCVCACVCVWGGDCECVCGPQQIQQTSVLAAKGGMLQRGHPFSLSQRIKYEVSAGCFAFHGQTDRQTE